MKRTILNFKTFLGICFVAGMSFTGCESIYTGDEFKIYEQEEPEGPELPEIPEIGKKGIGKSLKGSDWSSKVSRTKSHWHYSWGSKLTIKEPDNIDYVPMIWGRSGIDEDVVAELKDLKNEGKINFLLGFNEPDGVKQANMTVAEAVDLWPMLEEVGLPLGSPAVVGVDNEWLTEFMAEAETKGLRVDFICVHNYGGLSVEAFLDKLDAVHTKYGRPVWITEFAVGDWNASTVEEHKYTPEQVLAYMQEILPELEDRGYIHRYAWFPSSVMDPPLVSSALWDEEGNFTALGEYYANFKPNTLIGPGKDDLVDPNDVPENNIIINGGFETGALDPWQGFKNNVSLEAFAGVYGGKIENHDGSLFQVITVEPGQTYEVTFYCKWESAPPKQFNFLVKEETGAKAKLLVEPIEANENDWTRNAFTFTASQETTVRLVWYKGKSTPQFPPFYLDNAICLKVE
ncbi:hypothetical protein E9993_20595 [Labilibacter sediminis]|nr:hypothetical protein E9993_20595 [Labilibacter sediminis]